MKRLYHYRGKHNRVKKRLAKYINTVSRLVYSYTSFHVALQKVRQADMNLPEYQSGGVTIEGPASVGDIGEEMIINHQ